jgi:hypothetical protein
MTPEEIGELDDSEFDVDAIRIDVRHNNFSADRLAEYRHENIVQASLINGQFTQAREQCRSYGLDYQSELSRFNNH